MSICLYTKLPVHSPAKGKLLKDLLPFDPNQLEETKLFDEKFKMLVQNIPCRERCNMFESTHYISDAGFLCAQYNISAFMEGRGELLGNMSLSWNIAEPPESNESKTQSSTLPVTSLLLTLGSVPIWGQDITEKDIVQSQITDADQKTSYQLSIPVGVKDVWIPEGALWFVRLCLIVQTSLKDRNELYDKQLLLHFDRITYLPLRQQAEHEMIYVPEYKILARDGINELGDPCFF